MRTGERWRIRGRLVTTASRCRSALATRCSGPSSSGAALRSGRVPVLAADSRGHRRRLDRDRPEPAIGPPEVQNAADARRPCRDCLQAAYEHQVANSRQSCSYARPGPDPYRAITDNPSEK